MKVNKKVQFMEMEEVLVDQSEKQFGLADLKDNLEAELKIQQQDLNQQLASQKGSSFFKVFAAGKDLPNKIQALTNLLDSITSCKSLPELIKTMQAAGQDEMLFSSVKEVYGISSRKLDELSKAQIKRLGPQRTFDYEYSLLPSDPEVGGAVREQIYQALAKDPKAFEASTTIGPR